jgi:hypothetical protein
MRLAAGLEQQDLIAPVLGKPVGQRRTRRSRAHDNEIDRMLVHAFPHFHFLFCLSPTKAALFAAKICQSGR